MDVRGDFVLGTRFPPAFAFPIAGIVVLVFYFYDVEIITSYSGEKAKLSIHTSNKKMGNLGKYVEEVLGSGL